MHYVIIFFGVITTICVGLILVLMVHALIFKMLSVIVQEWTYGFIAIILTASATLIGACLSLYIIQNIPCLGR